LILDSLNIFDLFYISEYLKFNQIVEEKYPEKMSSGLRKTFSNGVSRFLEKVIRFSPTETTQDKKILESLNEIITQFDELIEKSIKEICQLIESGYQYVCDYNGNKIFRKLK